MIGLNRQSLAFPTLVFLKDGELITQPHPKFGSNPPPTDPKLIALSKEYTKIKKDKIRLYRLDWTYINNRKQNRHKQSAYSHKKMATLSKEHIKILESLVFAIPDSYMREINHCSQMANIEWEHRYPFDTFIRDTCTAPAIAFIKVAMRLLEDCIYDTKTKYYNRSFETSVMFRHLALLNFWYQQTGYGIAFRNAGLRIDMRTKDVIKSDFIHFQDSDSKQTIERLNEFVHDLLKFYNRIGKVQTLKLPETWDNEAKVNKLKL